MCVVPSAPVYEPLIQRGRRTAGRGQPPAPRGTVPCQPCASLTPQHHPPHPLSAHPPLLPPSQILEADLVLWSAGQAPVSRAGAATPSLSLPFPTNARGAMQTDASLRVLRHPRVFALGDISVRCVGGRGGGESWPDVAAASTVSLLWSTSLSAHVALARAAPPALPSTTAAAAAAAAAAPSCLCSSGGREQPALPATAQVAFQQADYVAWNLWAAINAKPMLSFRCGTAVARGVRRGGERVWYGHACVGLTPGASQPGSPAVFRVGEVESCRHHTHTIAQPHHHHHHHHPPPPTPHTPPAAATSTWET